MQVRHGLAGGLAGVRDDAESGVQALLGGYLGYDLENVRHCGGVLRCYLRGGVRDVLFRDDEDMRGGLGVDIPEGQDALVLIYLVRGDIPFRYHAEKAVFHFTYPPSKVPAS